MQSSCQASLKRYSLARQSSKHLLSQTDSLEQERDSVTLQLSLSKLFLQRFMLTPEEESVIRSKDPEIDEELFTVMDRLEAIRRDAQMLLGGSITDDPISLSPATPKTHSSAGGKGGGGIRAGVDVMDTSLTQLDAAYNKIAKWLSFEFRKPVVEGMEVSPRMTLAIKRMHDGGKDDMLRSALATLSSTRASFLSTSFQMALTVGGPPPSNLPRPIELHAHDPLRYVGDMLAWVHQALASEREFLASLFSQQEGGDGRRIGQRRRGLEGSLDMQPSITAQLAEEVQDGTLTLSSGERATRDLLDKNLDGCCRPLRTRILQTLQSQEGCITTFKLASLIDFYRLTIIRTLGSRASLSRTLQELNKAAYVSFNETLKTQAAGLRRYQDNVSATLDVPPPLVGAGTTLKELLFVLKTTLATENDETLDSDESLLDREARQEARRQLDFILAELVESMLDMCKRLSKAISDKRGRTKTEEEAKWEQKIFLCNCIEHVLAILDVFQPAKAKAQAVKDQLDEQTQSLTESLYAILLQNSHLKPVYEAAIGGISPETAEEQNPKPSSLDASVLQASLTGFNEFLASQSLVSSPKLSLLASPALRARVHQAALSKLADSYTVIAQNMDSLAEGSQVRLERSVEEIRVLLGVA